MIIKIHARKKGGEFVYPWDTYGYQLHLSEMTLLLFGEAVHGEHYRKYGVLSQNPHRQVIVRPISVTTGPESS